MAELLPEAWVEQPMSESCCRQGRRLGRRTPVTNILVWLKCYASMVAILGTAYPSFIGELMAYQQTIIVACRNFEETAWVVYDRIYRRRVAAQHSLNWSVVDSALYQQTFTGRALRIQRCTQCFSEHHTSSECPDNPSASQSFTVIAPTQPQQTALRATGRNDIHPRNDRKQWQDICQNFNQVKCRSRRCKYLHVCNLCQLPHPEVVCPTAATGSSANKSNRHQFVHQRTRSGPMRPTNAPLQPAQVPTV